MLAIEGDDTPWSYLSASLLGRQFKAFGAMWHGESWGTHEILGENPVTSGPGRNAHRAHRQAGRLEVEGTRAP